MGNFNISLTSLDISSKQKINKEITVLNDTLDKRVLTYTEHSTTEEYTFSSSVHETFSRVDHILDTKQIYVSKPLKRLKSYHAYFFYQNVMKLEIN